LGALRVICLLAVLLSPAALRSVTVARVRILRLSWRMSSSRATLVWPRARCLPPWPRRRAASGIAARNYPMFAESSLAAEESGAGGES
jgi:hypothetical protein